ICLGPTNVEASVGNASSATSAVRETFVGFLTGPSVTAAPLEARLASQARLEAKNTGCPYLLLTSLKHERKTGNGMFAKIAGSAAQQGAWAVSSSVSSTA